VAFEYPAYKELVIHPAPLIALNFPCVLSALFIPSKKVNKSVNKAYSYFIFWLENVVFLLFFFAFDLLLVFPIYLKNIPTMLFFSLGMFTSIFNTVVWIFFGIPYSIAIVFLDVKLLLKILCYHEGCKKGNDMRDEF
jgi:hypothetical protein